MSTEVKVKRLPPCDFCRDGTLADYDAKTVIGPWANMCAIHWRQLAMWNILGVGMGQRLVLEKTGEDKNA